MSREILPVIAGATASGKTAVAVELARQTGGEIISADSMQVYRHLSIGTAKPDPAELHGLPYHLIDHVEPDTQYNAGRFVDEANACIVAIKQRGRQPILCGGTGLYIRGLLYGLYEGGEPDLEIRRKLENRIDTEGLPALHAELTAADPTSAAIYGINDRQRITRALEVFYTTGIPLSAYHSQDLLKPLIPHHLYVLQWPRPVLYNRIDHRVDLMMQRGLLDEVSQYLKMGYTRDNAAIKALGYRELIAVLEGNLDLAHALDEMKKKSRNYAKRQETWFRGMPCSEWIKCDGYSPAEIAAQIRSHWEKLQQ